MALVQSRADALTEAGRVDGDTDPEPPLGRGDVGHFEEAEPGQLARCDFGNELQMEPRSAAACGGRDLRPGAWPVRIRRRDDAGNLVVVRTGVRRAHGNPPLHAAGS